MKGGKMGWLHPGKPKGLGDAMQHVGTSKAQHLSKFVEFYKSVSDHYVFNLTRYFVSTEIKVSS